MDPSQAAVDVVYILNNSVPAVTKMGVPTLLGIWLIVMAWKRSFPWNK